MSDVHTWSATAANNNSAAPNGWPEGMAISAVNNSAREVMAAVKKWYADDNGSLATTGSSNAYLLAPNRTITAYEAGLKFTFEANHTSTSTTPTLNVSSLGAKTITDQEGNALTIGDIVSGGIYTVTYDNGEGKFKLISSFVTASGLVPYAYCHVASDGTLQTGSLNITSASKVTDGNYTITLTSGVNSIAKCLTFATPAETASTDCSIGVNWASGTSLGIRTFLSSTAAAFNMDFSLIIYDTY